MTRLKGDLSTDRQTHWLSALFIGTPLTEAGCFGLPVLTFCALFWCFSQLRQHFSFMTDHYTNFLSCSSLFIILMFSRCRRPRLRPRTGPRGAEVFCHPCFSCKPDKQAHHMKQTHLTGESSLFLLLRVRVSFLPQHVDTVFGY